MTQWKYELDFSEFYHSDDITIEGKGKMASDCIHYLFVMSYSCDTTLQRILTGFSSIVETDMVEQDFNTMMRQLYDWADDNSVWIKT